MVPPTGDGGSPAPIDRPVLEFLRERLVATRQVDTATITDATGHLELRGTLASAYYPETVERAVLTVQWHTSDNFTIHYRETHTGGTWECRWDRHPNPHNSRDHFHPPPTASTPGEDRSWPADHRDVLGLVLDGTEERIAELWDAT